MSSKRLLSFLIPISLFLTGCQQVLATNEEPPSSISLAVDVLNYQQMITNETTTLLDGKESHSYTATEAAIFVSERTAYGSQIVKSSTVTPYKTRFYSSPTGAYQKRDQEEWQTFATSEPLYASAEVFSYDTFLSAAEILTLYSDISVASDTYVLSYSGDNQKLNRELSLTFGKMTPVDATVDATIEVDKDTLHLVSFELTVSSTSEAGNHQTTQRLTGLFSKHNQQGTIHPFNE